jgi:hypothetical protein
VTNKRWDDRENNTMERRRGAQGEGSKLLAKEKR